MKLLIITQRVDKHDQVLGFFHRWLELFAKETDELVVIAQSVGKYDLPSNTTVVSLGKEKGASKMRQLLRFWKSLFKNLRQSDAVFVHMVPLWIIAGAPAYVFFKKQVFLWYVHIGRGWLYRVSRFFVKEIFTAVLPSNIDSRKIMAVGHGIDIKHFSPLPKRKKGEKRRIICVGRIAKVKHCLEMLYAFDFLVHELGIKNAVFDFIGNTIFDRDEEYKKKLQNVIHHKNLAGLVRFVGNVEFDRMPDVYRSSDLLLNFTPANSFDKAALEALSCGVPTLVASSLFSGVVPNDYIIKNIADRESVAFRIKHILEQPSSVDFRRSVENRHNLYVLIPRIINDIRKHLVKGRNAL